MSLFHFTLLHPYRIYICTDSSYIAAAGGERVLHAPPTISLNKGPPPAEIRSQQACYYHVTVEELLSLFSLQNKKQTPCWVSLSGGGRSVRHLPLPLRPLGDTQPVNSSSPTPLLVSTHPSLSSSNSLPPVPLWSLSSKKKKDFPLLCVLLRFLSANPVSFYCVRPVPQPRPVIPIHVPVSSCVCSFTTYLKTSRSFLFVFHFHIFSKASLSPIQVCGNTQGVGCSMRQHVWINKHG